MEIISRAAAKALGRERFFTGNPCVQGHIAERFCARGQCVECAHKATRNWYDRNRAQKRALDQKRIQKKRISDRAWRVANAQEAADTTRQWRIANPERAIAADRNKRAAKPAKYRLISRLNGHVRRARITFQEPDTVSADEIAELLIKQRRRCAICGKPLRGGFEVDHIVPIARRGRHSRRNLQLVHGRCNRKKGARDPIEFFRAMGRLL